MTCTIDDIKMCLKMLTANFGEDFYKGTSEEDVLALWAVDFRDEDPKALKRAVMNCIDTLTFKPRIADIRKRIGKSATKGQLTAVEAFQEISKAVAKGYDRDSAAQAFNALPPTLRRVVGFPEQLISWRKVSDESFQTVIMSAIRESYREIAQQEAEYHQMSKGLQQTEKWRLKAPGEAELPAIEAPKTVDEILEESNRKAAEHGMQMTADLAQKHAGRVADFRKPMTKLETKKVEYAEKAKAERYL